MIEPSTGMDVWFRFTLLQIQHSSLINHTEAIRNAFDIAYK